MDIEVGSDGDLVTLVALLFRKCIQILLFNYYFQAILALALEF